MSDQINLIIDQFQPKESNTNFKLKPIYFNDPIKILKNIGNIVDKIIQKYPQEKYRFEIINYISNIFNKKLYIHLFSRFQHLDLFLLASEIYKIEVFKFNFYNNCYNNGIINKLHPMILNYYSNTLSEIENTLKFITHKLSIL